MWPVLEVCGVRAGHGHGPLNSWTGPGRTVQPPPRPVRSFFSLANSSSSSSGRLWMSELARHAWSLTSCFRDRHPVACAADEPAWWRCAGGAVLTAASRY